MYQQGWSERSAVKDLMLVTIVVYILQLTPGIGEKLTFWGANVPGNVFHGQVWRVFTYAFLHDTNSFMHIAFNMFGLWMFGRTLEYRWSYRKFMTFYLLSALTAGIFATVVYYLRGDVGMIISEGGRWYQVGGHAVRAIGASGAIMALFVMFAMYYPYEKLYLFMVLPIEARFAVPLFALLSVTMGFGGAGDIDHFGHLGGIIAGLLYFWKEQDFDYYLAKLAGNKPSNVYSFKKPKPNRKNMSPAAKREELDRILGKVSASGLDSLTPQERAILQEHSDQLRGF